MRCEYCNSRRITGPTWGRVDDEPMRGHVWIPSVMHDAFYTPRGKGEPCLWFQCRNCAGWFNIAPFGRKTEMADLNPPRRWPSIILGSALGLAWIVIVFRLIDEILR